MVGILEERKEEVIKVRLYYEMMAVCWECMVMMIASVPIGKERKIKKQMVEDNK